MFRVELQPTATSVSTASTELYPCSSFALQFYTYAISFTQILATISGKIRKNQVRIIVGDVVKVC
jgi:hypothetical protein